MGRGLFLGTTGGMARVVGWVGGVVEGKFVGVTSLVFTYVSLPSLIASYTSSCSNSVTNLRRRVSTLEISVNSLRSGVSTNTMVSSIADARGNVIIGLDSNGSCTVAGNHSNISNRGNLSKRPKAM